MARKTNNKIIKEHLILCEGRDAQEFLIAYLNSEALSFNRFFSNEFQVMDFGGNEELDNYITNLKNMEGYENIKSLLIIQDAERNAQNALNHIRGVLGNCGFIVPRQPCEWAGDSLKIGYLLFPTCSTTVYEGTLEDLCLSILSEDIGTQIVAEIQNLMDCLGEKYNRTYPHEFKTKLHTYFSVTDKYVSLKIGEAAKAGAFEWGSEKLMAFRDFLLQLES